MIGVGRVPLRDHALHAVAWVALRVAPPLRALAWLRRIARSNGAADVGAARSMHRGLASYGTCLSRAMAIAARFPEARVIIAVDPGASPSADVPLRAHAWVELDGIVVGEDAPHTWAVIGDM